MPAGLGDDTGSAGIVRTKHVTFDEPGRTPRARERRRALADHPRLRDLRHAQRGADNAILVFHALSGRRARRRAPQRQRQARRLVGHPHRAGQGARHRQVLRHLRQRDRRLQRLDRPVVDRPGDGQAVRYALSRSSRSPTWSRPRCCCSTTSASTSCSPPSAARWAACRSWSWPCRTPTRLHLVVALATAARQPTQAIAFNEVGRQAIMADPDWRGGHYYGGKPPSKGLAVARMVGHITYLSDEAMQEKFGRRLQDIQRLHVHLRAGLRGRELPAPPGARVHQPLRRQHLPVHHEGARLLRPLAPPRQPRLRLPRREGALPRACRSRATGCTRRTSSRRSSAPCARRTSTSPTTRSRPTTATTPSCSSARRWRA